jgi:hypothetical protein
VIDGIKIARRGYPGTPQAGTWVSLEPGWRVLDGKGQVDAEGEGTIEISFTPGATMH